ncbi:TPA: hypothetical protein LA460_003396 [Clostridium botulinum]|nr:hypothetical protein [Clostridium botulinum]HBJ1655902.1 hypothetical protein [Clostridium botulinum]
MIKNGNGENGLDFWIKRGNIVFSKFGEFTGNQWTGLDQILKVKQNTDYIISCNHSPNSNIFVMGVKSTGGNTLAFNTGNNNVITISLQSSVVGNQTVTFSEIQLVEGTTVAKYEPYKEDKTEILIPNEPLRGIGDIRDIITFDKNERIKNIAKDIWNGNEDWIVNSSIDNEIVFQSLFSKSKTTSSIKGEVIFNKNLKVIAFSETNIFARIDKSQLSTPDVAGFKKLLKTWADAGTPLEVYYPLANPITEKLNIKDTLQTFQDGYIMLDNAITPTAQLEYSTNLPSAIGSLTGITDKLVDDVTNVEITISDMDAEIGEARKGKTTLEERLEEDRTNILSKINECAKKKESIIYKQTFSGSENLNDIIEQGVYQIADATNMSNIPNTNNKSWSILEVIASNTYVKQIYSSAIDATEFTRTKTEHTNGWNGWQQLATVDDTGWIDLPLESGITIDSGLTPRYRKVNNQVFVDGSVKGIDSKNKIIGILPVGFRPTSNHYYSGFTNGFAPTAMTLASNGNISVQGNYGDQYTINNFAIICTNFMI